MILIWIIRRQRNEQLVLSTHKELEENFPIIFSILTYPKIPWEKKNEKTFEFNNGISLEKKKKRNQWECFPFVYKKKRQKKFVKKKKKNKASKKKKKKK